MFSVQFDCFNVSCFCGNNAWTVSDEVATCGDAGSLWLILLRSDCADNSREGHGPALGDLVLVNEEDGVGAFDSIAKTLCEVAKFICCRLEPIIPAVGILD